MMCPNNNNNTNSSTNTTNGFTLCYVSLTWTEN